MMSPAHHYFPPEILALDEEIGNFMEYWGFKRIHGRVWLHLFLSDVPLDVAELMRRLRVSKALMSFCLRDLKEYGVVIEDGIAKHGTVLYRANADVFGVIQNVLRTREQPMLGRIKAAQQASTKLSPTEIEKHKMSAKRVRELGRLVSAATAALGGVIRFSTLAGDQGVDLVEMLRMMGGGDE